jgi:ubiquinone biosynthesis protein
MLRKNIKNEILDCLKLTKFFIMIINNLNWLINSKIRINNVIENIETCLVDQCDFNKEVSNLELFYETYTKSSDILIPKVYKDYTNHNTNIIVMDYLDGKNLHELNENEIDVYSKIFNKYIITSLLLKKLFNTDFHSGNIIFMKKNNKYSIGIIDFGMIKKLNKYEYNLMNDIFYALIQENYENLFKTIVTRCIVSGNNKQIYTNNVEIIRK